MHLTGARNGGHGGACLELWSRACHRAPGTAAPAPAAGHVLDPPRHPPVDDLAFEPDEEARNRLIRNLSLNGFSDDCRLTLSDKPIRRKKDETASYLDEVLCSVPSPFLVKVDVDRGETEASDLTWNAIAGLSRSFGWGDPLL